MLMRNFFEPCAVEEVEDRFGGSAPANDALCCGLQITNDRRQEKYRIETTGFFGSAGDA